MTKQVNLRDLRERRMMTQEELAALAHVSDVTISNIENGHRKPRHTTIRKIAEALGMDPLELRGLVAA